MTLAGVVGPTLLTAAIFTMAKLGGYVNVSWLAIVALSIPAMATDVAFSVGTQKISRIGGRPNERKTQGSMLEGLGIGDDVAGLLIMTLVYTAFESYTLLFLWGGFMIFVYMIGERGTYTDRVQLVARLNAKGDYTEIGDQPVQYFMHIIRAEPVLLWWAFMALSTIAIVGMGVNPVLGGCLPIIFAPDRVKEQISAMVEPITVVVLFFFGLSAGLAVDFFDPASYTWITLCCFVGAHFGKLGSIFTAGVRARSKLPDESSYKQMPTWQIFHLATEAAETGTVSIIFVKEGLRMGWITPDVAAQAMLGFILTIPAGVIWTLIAVLLRKLGTRFGKKILDDDAEFERAVSGDD